VTAINRRPVRLPPGGGSVVERIGWTPDAEVEWARMAEDQRLGRKRTISEAEADRLERRQP
jgi:hypothetical protein